MLRLDLLAMGVVLLGAATARADDSFDRTHAAWTTLLAAHVHWNAAATATTVDYAGFARDRTALDAYRGALASVGGRELAAWPPADQLAFLINAYNANTVAFVLTRYPDLTSIKDLGGFFTSPWKQRFVELLGATRTLDEIEHGMIRGGVGAGEPRVHFVLNCASVGCPALRPEAYRGALLDGQLADQARRFLADRSRNRYDATSDHLQLSKIFDWYGGDFERAGSVATFLAAYAEQLSGDAAIQRRIAAATVPLEFLDYDWRLNDVEKKP
jgi:Protein of unknown function, DUF547